MPRNEHILWADKSRIGGIYVRCSEQGIVQAKKMKKVYLTKFGIELPFFTYCPLTGSLQPIDTIEALEEQLRDAKESRDQDPHQFIQSILTPKQGSAVSSYDLLTEFALLAMSNPDIFSCLPALEDTKIITVLVEHMTKAGAISPLVKLIQSGTDPQKEHAARALGALACENSTNQKTIAKAGAISPLVKLIQSGTDPQKEHAARALGALAFNSTQILINYLTPIKKNIVKAGAIRPLVQLLSGTPPQKEHAAAALGVLAFNSTIKKNIAKAGAIDPLVQLKQSGSPRQKQYASKALYRLSWKHFFKSLF